MTSDSAHTEHQTRSDPQNTGTLTLSCKPRIRYGRDPCRISGHPSPKGPACIIHEHESDARVNSAHPDPPDLSEQPHQLIGGGPGLRTQRPIIGRPRNDRPSTTERTHRTDIPNHAAQEKPQGGTAPQTPGDLSDGTRPVSHRSGEYGSTRQSGGPASPDPPQSRGSGS